MEDEFKNYIERYFGEFLHEHKMKMLTYKYERGSFGDGLAEYENPRGIRIKIIRDRSQWYVEMKNTTIIDEWFELMIILSYEDERYKEEREKIYSDFEIKEEEHIHLIRNLLVVNYTKIEDLLGDKKMLLEFREYYQKWL